MVKLSMCRICLADDVQLRLIVDSHLREMYETLIKKPFVTEDIRPLQVCYRCCTRLEHCHSLRRRCLQSERLFHQILKCNVKVNLQLKPNIHQSSETVCRKIPLGSNIHPSEGDEVQVTPEVCDNEKGTPGDAVVVENDPLKDDDCMQLSDLEDDPKEQSGISAGTDDESNSSADLEDDYEKMEEHLRKELNVPDLKTSNPGPSKRQREDRCEDSGEDSGENSGEDVGDDSCEDITLEDIIGWEEKERQTHRRLKDSAITANEPRYNIHKPEKKNRKCKFWQCSVCLKIYRIQSRFDNHVCTYKCELCQKCFDHKGHYQTHMRMHTGEKPFKCNVCQKSFSEKNRLNNHMRVHTGSTNFQCNVCKKCFNDRGNLHSHIRIHTGEKPFQCHVCKKGFTTKGSLNIHLHRMHDIVEKSVK